MIKEIVDSIIEAENKAEQTIADAQEKAKNILFEANGKKDEIFSDSLNQRKAETNASRQKALAAAEKKGEKVFEKAKTQADEKIKTYEKNKGCAIDFIVEKVKAKCQ